MNFILFIIVFRRINFDASDHVTTAIVCTSPIRATNRLFCFELFHQIAITEGFKRDDSDDDDEELTVLDTAIANRGSLFILHIIIFIEI